MFHPNTSVARVPRRISRRHIDSFALEILDSGLPLLKSLHLIYFSNSPKADDYRRDILTMYGIRERCTGYKVLLRERGIPHEIIRLLHL